MNTSVETTSAVEEANRMPLDRVKPGKRVRIKALAANPEMTCRLRELGFCEGQVIRLITCHSHIICQICNARMALTAKLAQMVMVESVTGF